MFFHSSQMDRVSSHRSICFFRLSSSSSAFARASSCFIFCCSAHVSGPLAGAFLQSSRGEAAEAVERGPEEEVDEEDEDEDDVAAGSDSKVLEQAGHVITPRLPAGTRSFCPQAGHSTTTFSALVCSPGVVLCASG